MINFLKFIEEDIEAKKSLLSTMPINNKRNIKKYNDRIDTIIEKYQTYLLSVKKYSNAKSISFEVEYKEKENDKLNKEIESLENIKFILNPTNTYFEKMGFDNLLYEISNYYDLNFNSLNDIINEFISKFELAGIKLNTKHFNYTFYVHEYMKEILSHREKDNKSKENITKKFEEIYWKNPEIIAHIELNFRRLIKKYEKRLINYVLKFQKDVHLKSGISNYETCLKKLKELYVKLDEINRENIADVIKLAKNGEIDINNYFEDSKIRTNTYEALSIEPLDFDNKEIMKKFYLNLEKLKINIEEYLNYVKFIPLIEDFKKEYESQIPLGDKDANKINVSKNLDKLETEIEDKEEKLAKINKKIFATDGPIKSYIRFKLDGIKILKKYLEASKIRKLEKIKQLKIDSVKRAQELYDLYKNHDKEFFNDKVLSILTPSFTTAELLNLYYSFDYFKKLAIKRVYELNNYDEIVQYSEDFDLFAMNTMNIIVSGVMLFDENDIPKVISNKYRLDNINLNNENLSDENLEKLLSDIKLLLRVKLIEESDTTIEQIWFIVQEKKMKSIKCSV